MKCRVRGFSIPPTVGCHAAPAKCTKSSSLAPSRKTSEFQITLTRSREVYQKDQAGHVPACHSQLIFEFPFVFFVPFVVNQSHALLTSWNQQHI